MVGWWWGGEEMQSAWERGLLFAATVLQARREQEKAESLEKTTGLEMQSDSQDGQSGSEETEQGRKGQQGSFQTLCPAQTSGTFPVCGGNLRTGRK